MSSLQVGPGDSRTDLLVTADQFYLYRLRVSCGPNQTAAVFLAPVSRPDTDGTLALVFQAPTKRQPNKSNIFCQSY